MLSYWINKEYLQKKHIVALRNRFLKVKPFPYLALKCFFKENRLLNVRKAALKEEFQFIDRDLFSFSQTNELFYSENNVLKGFYALFSSREFQEMISTLTGEKFRNKADMHAHLFKQGDYLLFHNDVVEKRKVAYVVNLSQGFTAKDGGRLQLFDANNPATPKKEIPPDFGTFILFKVSQRSLHAVQEVLTAKQRLTLSGWFHGH